MHVLTIKMGTGGRTDHITLSIQLWVFLITTTLKVYTACDVPQPKILHKEECDCYNNGSDVMITCYSEVKCFNPNDPTFMYRVGWIGFIDNNDTNVFHHLSEDTRYQDEKRTKNHDHNMTTFMVTLTIRNVSSVDYTRQFMFMVFTAYTDMEQLPPLHICNYTEKRVVTVDARSDLPLVIGTVASLVVIAGVCACCSCINLPFVKYGILRCRGRDIIRKRLDTENLSYDTALLYDTAAREANLIGDSLYKELKSRQYDVASAGDVIGSRFNELQLIPASATVIYIITADSNTDQLLNIARDVASKYKASREQILVYTNHVPAEFKQYKLLHLPWPDDKRKKKSRDDQEHYRVVSTTEPGAGLNRKSSVVMEINSEKHSNEKEAVNTSIYRTWKQKKFYMAVYLGLSEAFRKSDVKADHIINEVPRQHCNV
ncbi:uncharacterized protein [Argopecten irradians]|uniref:uncharacterized protein n=1 Tax=Argopecten irradians TaxID=31199 RepID=UPI0037231DA7